MTNFVRSVFALFAALAFGLVAEGCGPADGPTYIYNTTIETPAPMPSDPFGNEPTPTPTPTPTPQPGDPAPVPTPPLASVRLEYAITSQGVANGVMVASIKVVALQDNLALRRLRIKTDTILSGMSAYVLTSYYSSAGSGQSNTLSPTTEFTIESSSRLDMGLCPLAGDSLYLQLYTDSTSLDGQKVTFTVESVDVSVGNDAVQTILDKMPAPFAVTFGEYPQIEGVAIVSSRAAVRSTETVLEEFELRNVGNHDVDLLSVRFNVPEHGLDNVVSLKTVVGNNLTVGTSPGQDGNALSGQMLTVDTSIGNIVLAPGQSVNVRLIGDTLNAGAKAEVFNDLALVGIHGDNSRMTWVYEAYAITFTTTFVNEDRTTTLRQQQLDRTLGPVDGSFAVMRLQVDNPTGTDVTLTNLTCQVNSTDIANTSGVAWLQFRDSVGSSKISSILAYRGNNRFSLGPDAGITITVPAGSSIVIEVFATAPLLGTSDTFQMTLVDMLTSEGLIINLSLTPPQAPSILIP